MFRIGFTVLLAAAGLLFYLYRQSDPICEDCNVIFISIDTLRADHMGVYGYKKDTTPNIDQWAKSATKFSNYYTIFPLTTHSFFSLFTGGDDEVLNGPLTEDYPTDIEGYTNKATLPTILKSNNYHTAAFVTNPLLGTVLKFFRRGLDEYNFVNTSGLGNYDPELYANTYRDQIKLTSASIKWLNKYRDKKFFLWLHYLNPHAPYLPPDQYLCRIDTYTCINKTYDEKLLADSDPQLCNVEKLSENDRQHEINLYDAELLSTDEQIGRILEAVEDMNLTKKTVIVLLADHGEGFDHNIYHHGNSLYSSALKIPLIIYVPGTKEKSSDMLLDNTNVTATLLDLLNIKFPESTFAGKSFIDVFYHNKTQNKELNKVVYFRTPSNRSDRIGVTDGNYKYILNNDDYCTVKNDKEELYNLKNDPEEMNNLAEKDKSLVEKYRKYLSEKFKEFVTPPSDSQNRKDIIEKFKSLGY